ALLVREPRFRVPATAVQLLVPGTEHGQLLSALSGRGYEPHGNRLREPVDHEQIAARGIADDVRRPVLEARVDPGGIGVRRLGDVGVRGNDRLRHRRLLSWVQGACAGHSALASSPPLRARCSLWSPRAAYCPVAPELWSAMSWTYSRRRTVRS